MFETETKVPIILCVWSCLLINYIFDFTIQTVGSIWRMITIDRFILLQFIRFYLLIINCWFISFWFMFICELLYRVQIVGLIKVVHSLQSRCRRNKKHSILVLFLCSGGRMSVHLEIGYAWARSDMWCITQFLQVRARRIQIFHQACIFISLSWIVVK